MARFSQQFIDWLLDHPKMDVKLFRVWRQHKNNAEVRGIPFLLTFDEWLDIWEMSGHFEKRGNRKNCYVMARYGDKGSYVRGNVRIITVEENTRESNLINPRAWPGESNPYFGKKHSKTVRKKMSKPHGHWWTRPDGTQYVSFNPHDTSDKKGRINDRRSTIVILEP